MKSLNSAMVFLALSIFLLQFSLNLTNFSVISYSSFSYSGLLKTSVTVLFGALGSLIALIFSFLEPSSTGSNSYLRKNTYGILLIIASGFACISEFSSMIWLFCYMVMNTCFSRLIAFQMVEVGRVDSLSIEKNNKILQITSTFSVLMGVGLAPLIAVNFPIKTIVAIGALCSLLNLFTFGYFLSMTRKNGDVRAGEIEFSKKDGIVNNFKKNILLYYLIFSAWLLGGFFYVIEVPLLIERFSATASEVSYIFLLSVVSNILFMIFFKVHVLKRKLHSILFYSTLVLLWLAPIYCYNYSKLFVPVIIILYGALNGVFNISSTTIIQQFAIRSDRLNGLLIARLLSQFAILIGALICFSFNTHNVYRIMFIFAVFLSIPLLMSNEFRLKFFIKKMMIFFIFTASVARSEDTDSLIRVKTQNIPISLKSSEVLDSSSALILKQVFDSLYVYDENNFLNPVLVKKQQWEKNFKKLTIEIDTNRKFSDGTLLTAGVIAESLGNTIRELGEGGRWAVGTLEGFAGFLKSKEQFPRGIVPKSLSVLEFNFSSPTPNFIQSLASPYFLISKKEKNGNLIGTGAFVIKEKSEHHFVIKLLNSEKKSGEIKEVVFSNKEDRFFKNNIDISFEEPLNIKLNPYLKERSYNYLQTVVLMLNTKHEYFKIAKNRCTVGGLIHLAFGDSEYSWKPIELGLPFSWSITQNSSKINNDDRNKKQVNLEVMYANSAAFFNEDINNKISINLKKNNINVMFKKLTIKDLIKHMRKGDFQAALLGYVPDFPNSDSLLTPFIGTSQQYNFSGYSNKRVDDLLASGRDVTDRVAQNEIYKKVFLILNQECPIDYLGTQKGKFWAKEKLYIPPFSSLGYHFINFKHVILNR